ncbi:MAG: hypothetical protein WA172_14005 [Terriglobales bacterium]|jgi:hypothetical protein
MRRIFSQSFHVRIFLTVLATLLLAIPAAYGQSLGDVARENREQKAANASPPPKVITNKSLPKDPDAVAGSSAGKSQTQAQTEPSPANAESSKQAARQRAAERRAAQQWKQKILAQENTIANLRLRADKLKASIHFVDPNNYYPYDSNSAYTGLAENRYQARQLERLAQMRQQLDQQKKKLEDMQEAARHAGMHTTVYDP